MTQVAELRQLVDQLQSQLAESAQQRASMEHRLDQAESAKRALEARLHELQELATSERQVVAEHLKSVKNRALTDVDRARQESKGARAEVATAAKKYAAKEAELRKALNQALAATAAATAEANVQLGRTVALEEQLAKLQSLPADVEAALQRTRAPNKKRSPHPRVRKKG